MEFDTLASGCKRFAAASFAAILLGRTVLFRMLKPIMLCKC